MRTEKDERCTHNLLKANIATRTQTFSVPLSFRFAHIYVSIVKALIRPANVFPLSAVIVYLTIESPHRKAHKRTQQRECIVT